MREAFGGSGVVSFTPSPGQPRKGEHVMGWVIARTGVCAFRRVLELLTLPQVLVLTVTHFKSCISLILGVIYSITRTIIESHPFESGVILLSRP